MAIIIPRREIWTRQPPAGTPLDWSNPINNDLVGVWVPGTSRRNLVTGVDLVPINGGCTKEATKKGLATANHGLSLNGTTNPAFTTDINIDVTKPFLLLAWFSSDDLPSTSGYGAPFQGNATYGLGFTYHHSSTAFQNAFQVRTTSGWFAAKFDTPVAKKPLMWVGMCDLVNIKAYTNGILSNTTALTGYVVNGGNLIIMGRAGNYNFNGDGVLFAAWNGDSVKNINVKKLNDNPLQIFAP